MPKISRNGVVGIDPGATGGIVYLGDSRVVRWNVMPSTQRDILLCLTKHQSASAALIEKPSLGHPGTGKSQMAKLWGNYTELCMALTALKIPFASITPATWIRGLGIPPRRKSESRRLWKDRLREKAQQLFPELDVWEHPLGVQRSVCDAILIAEYYYRSIGQGVAN